MNTILIMVIEAIVTFGIVVLIDKFFGKKGLLAFAPVLLIAANVGSSKISMIGIGELSTTLGIPAFAAMFLLTDILNEKYGKEDAKKAIIFAIIGQIAFLLLEGISMIYTPAPFDTVDGAIHTLFSINWRVTVASIIMFAVSNFADVWLFDLLKRKNVPLWVRNNVATVTTNCLENFLFLTIAFVGVMPFENIMISALVCSALEAMVAFLDTPFLYLSKKSEAVVE